MGKPPSYLDFIWKDKRNRKYLLYGLAACLLQFVIFKLLYPFPDFFDDSFWYFYAAYHKLDISVWPIGYSKFLSAFHFLTPSDTALIAFQYFLFQLSAIHFYFTLLYFFKIKPWIQNSLFLFIILSPLTLYLANTLASDTIFAALTLLWLSELIRILFRPKNKHLVIEALLLFCCFTMRNTAYYYPIIAAMVIILAKQSVWKKLAGIALPFLFLIPFILYTRDAANKLTGTRTFSLLTGWQMANNALYMYKYIDVDSTQLPTEKARLINRFAIQFFQRTPPPFYQLFLNSTDGNVFVLSPASPLRTYYNAEQKNSASYDIIKQSGIASVELEQFGRSIILHHPWGYLRHFVLMNAGNYFLPQLSDLKSYSNNKSRVDPAMAIWFHYPDTQITCISHSFQGYLIIYQLFFAFLHIYLLGVFVPILAKPKSIQFPSKTVHLYLLVMGYLMINAIFSISVTINLLRYQFVPMYILLLTDLLLTENILNLYSDETKKNKK